MWDSSSGLQCMFMINPRAACVSFETSRLFLPSVFTLRSFVVFSPSHTHTHTVEPPTASSGCPLLLSLTFVLLSGLIFYFSFLSSNSLLAPATSPPSRLAASTLSSSPPFLLSSSPPWPAAPYWFPPTCQRAPTRGYIRPSLDRRLFFVFLRILGEQDGGWGTDGRWGGRRRGRAPLRRRPETSKKTSVFYFSPQHNNTMQHKFQTFEKSGRAEFLPALIFLC